MKTVESQINAILKAKGQFVSVSWESDVKPAAKFDGIHLQKRTSAVVRAGIDFANLTTVKSGIENGERQEVGELPWGKWVKFPYLIEHKGSFYLRLYSVNGAIPKVEYLLNGTRIDKRVFASFLTPSASKRLLEPSTSQYECFTIKASNIIEIA